jgi:peptidoglycan/LPS O-acetylase OafA/YrhL
MWVYNLHYGLMCNYKVFDCLIDVNQMSPLKNGDLGVDMFFVLSGFLITDILIREIERDGSINTFHFLRSRFLRIWPAMLVYFFISLIFGENIYNGLKSLLFVSNFWGIETHLWSVCVEF